MTNRKLLPTALMALMSAWPAALWAQANPNFQIFVLDTRTGQVSQVTHLPAGFDAYNPAFSPDRKRIVHDIVSFPGGAFYQEIAVTNLKSGVTVGTGIPYSDNGKWSRTGQYLAFDLALSAGAVEVVDASTGALVLNRAGAAQPTWSPNGRRLAFVDSTDGFLHTVSLNGTETSLASVGAHGCAPSWSPSGGLIAYIEDCPGGLSGTRLMVVPVSARGLPLGMPYQVSDGSYTVGTIAFAPDGNSIVFSGTATGGTEFGLYTISVSGGSPVSLHDIPGVPEYDPAYSPRGRFVAFSTLPPP